MIALAHVGIDHRPYYRTGDPMERLLDEIVAEGVIDIQNHNAEQRIKRITGEIANKVGSLVGQALGEALKAIARAMRG